MAPPDASAGLARAVRSVAREAGAREVAVAFHDHATRTAWSLEGDRSFHAASTIKVAVLVAVFEAIDRGALALHSRLHVRNRFLSRADGTPFRVPSERDANGAVHRMIGKTMRIDELARHMVVTSSNLATNLLLDLVGVETARRVLAEADVEGIDLVRGVEDERAHEDRIDNRVTANGLVRLFRLIGDEGTLSADARTRMLAILRDQEFVAGIPAGLPEEATVAHKTGEISTVAHDAGIVSLGDRPPYVLAILTGWDPEAGGRRETIARISALVYQYLRGEEEGVDGHA